MRSSAERARENPGPDPLNIYLRDIAKLPQLSVDEERSVAARAREGDLDAQKRLIEANLRFVVAMARKYARSGYSLSELVNEGNLGLIEAAMRFDPSRGVRFITYAGWWVRQAMLAAIAHQGQSFRVPPKLKHELYQFESKVSRLAQLLGRRPSPEDIADQLGLSSAEVARLQNAIPREVSLSSPIDESGEIRIEDLVEDTRAIPVDEALATATERQDLMVLLSQLNDKERSVLERRFGLGDAEPETLAEIGVDLHLSRERIRQIEERALEKLRASSRAKRLVGYLN